MVKRGFEILACLLPVLGVESLESERAGDQPSEERRERWSEIAWGRRIARARSTRWSTAETRRDHWGRVLATDVKISSICLKELMAMSRVSKMHSRYKKIVTLDCFLRNKPCLPYSVRRCWPPKQLNEEAASISWSLKKRLHLLHHQSGCQVLMLSVVKKKVASL